MPSISTIELFLLAVVVLVIIPGPNVIYIVTRSLDQGRWAGLVSSFGVEVGTFVHVVAAACGLSALLVSSSLAFMLVKYAGAAYLVYLGIRALISRDPLHPVAEQPVQRHSRLFLQGVIVNVLNPKTAIFVFAFLPQFVDPASGAIAWQILWLGTLLVLVGTCSDILYALLAGSLGHWFKANTRILRRQRYITGGVYMTLGVMTAFTGGEHR